MDPVGIKIPILLGKNGFFDQTFTTLDEVKYNIINLLFTRRRERLMQPLYGTRIYELLFENITEDLQDVLEEEIREQIKFWIPYAIVKNVIIDVSPVNIDKNKISIGLTYSAKADPNNFDTLNLEFTF